MSCIAEIERGSVEKEIDGAIKDVVVAGYDFRITGEREFGIPRFGRDRLIELNRTSCEHGLLILEFQFQVEDLQGGRLIIDVADFQDAVAITLDGKGTGGCRKGHVSHDRSGAVGEIKIHVGCGRCIENDVGITVGSVASRPICLLRNGRVG